MLNNRTQLIQDENEHLEFEGFKASTKKSLLTNISYFLTFGIVRLVFHWFPRYKLLATHNKCNLDDATSILITDIYKEKYKTYFVQQVNELTSNAKLSYYTRNAFKTDVGSVRLFNCKQLTYIWEVDARQFSRLVGLENGIKQSDLHEMNGLSEKEANLRRIIYGMNSMNTPLNTIWELFLREAFSPFYVFQLFTIVVWIAELYIYYAIAIVIMTAFAITSSIIQTRRNQRSLHKTVHIIDDVIVKRGKNDFTKIKSNFLVPGDVIVVPDNGGIMQCDAILLNGSCVVNESMLTGESVPIIKQALPHSNDAIFNQKHNHNHILYGGTKIIQTRSLENEPCLAVITHTGFLTTKGQLVQSILYPPPADFRFDKDSYKYIWILSIIALIGVIYTAISKSSRHLDALDIVLKALDTITIIIPPALPAAMTIGKLYAGSRLQEKKIFCINSRVINVSGSIDCVCFDKTGTLTEDGLDVWGVIPVKSSKFQQAYETIDDIPTDLKLIDALACCHSLINIDGQLEGDPLDAKMFAFTKCDFKEGGNGGEVRIENHHFAYDLIHLNNFQSSLQRMSVVVKSETTQLGGKYHGFVKGSPEMIVELSKSHTIPFNFKQLLKTYTEKGYRVLGVGRKELHLVNDDESARKLRRESVECDLEFLGLIIFENKVKPLTGNVIRTLRKANMKVVMITGDNIETAISVAYETGILEGSVVEVQVQPPNKNEDAKLIFNIVTKKLEFDTTEKYYNNGDLESQVNFKKFHFIMIGSTWSQLVTYFPNELATFVTRGTIFARMSSDQKQQLVEELKIVGYNVCMCGDGTNDCGALRAAHVGISLSEAEASVASPFTSQIAHISSTLDVIREGRAALSTSFGLFKLMIAYSLTEYTSVMILYENDNNLSNMQFLFIDICLVLIGVTVFGKTKAYVKDLYPKGPTISLLSAIPLISLILFLATSILFQAMAYNFIQTFDWFTPFKYSGENVYDSYENFAVFSVSMFEYLTLFIIFSKGFPYRLPIYTNKPLMIDLICFTLICAYCVAYPPQWLCSVLNLKPLPKFDGILLLFILIIINCIFSFIIEELFVDYLLQRKLKCFRGKPKRYEEIENKLRDDNKWNFIRSDYNNISYESDFI